MTETQERFLRAVLTRVPLDGVVEMHLFPPIRRGTMETGVAVIATLLPPPPLTVMDTSADIDVDANADAVIVENDIDASAVAEDAAPVANDASVDDESPYADDAPVAEADDAVVAAHDDVTEPADDDETHVDVDAAAAPDAEEIVAPAPAPSPRMRILTAAYRHTIKGIDRGKWIVDVQEEADAPLEAVEAVLRGVRQRSTEPADPELVSHDALAALLEPARVAPAA